MRAWTTIALAAATVLAVVAAHAAGAVTASPAFRLSFDGKHNASLWHEGPFTASAAFCSSGYATDVEVDDPTLISVRRFSCNGGGEFTARVTTLRAEHGGRGTWQILGGAGPLADLRGRGSFTSLRVGGSPDDPASITFQSTWDGVADFDVQAPTISIASATARTLLRPKGSVRVRATVSFDDAGGGVAYSVLVSDARKPLAPLATKNGVATGARVDVTLRFLAPRGLRATRVQVEATDPVGNRSSLVKTVRLTSG